MWGGGPPPNNPSWQQQGGSPAYGQQQGGYNQYGASAPPPQQGYGGNPYGGSPYGGAPPAGHHGASAPPPAQYQAPGGGYGGAPGGGYGGAPGGGYGGAPQGPPGVSPELYQWFLAVDQDKSGQISAQELQKALMNGNWKPFNEETCRLMIGMFDRNRSGTIDIQEFAALWKYIQDWKGCFERFDTDRSGNIDTGEFHNAITTFGYNLSMDFCSMVVRLFDREGRGTMAFDAFIQSCVMLKSYTDAFRKADYQQRGVVTIQYEQFLEMVLDHVVK